MFESAKLKIKWADHHIRNAERQIENFVKSNRHGITSHTDSGIGLHTLTLIGNANRLPDEIPLIIADAIHNLRCALDHMTWELVGWDHGTQNRHLKFPTGEDRTSFDGTCNGIKTPSGIAPNILKSLEAFPGGAGHVLYVLNNLDNADKHTVLTPIIDIPRVKKLILRDAAGKITHTLTNLSDVILKPGETLSIDTSPIDTFFNFEDDTEISPDILFGNVKFVKDQPVVPTLAQLRHATAEAIRMVETSISL